MPIVDEVLKKLDLLSSRFSFYSGDDINVVEAIKKYGERVLGVIQKVPRRYRQDSHLWWVINTYTPETVGQILDYRLPMEKARIATPEKYDLLEYYCLIWPDLISARKQRTKLIEYRIRFIGHVQDVGFRAETEELAYVCGRLKGFVENMDDGSVKVVAQGQKHFIELFIKGLKRRFGKNIEKIEKEEREPKRKYREFEVKGYSDYW